MSKLEQGFKTITEAFQEDFVEKYKSLLKLASETIEDRYCLCNDNRNMHDNGEGGSPSKCENPDCMCADYHYSLIRSLLHHRDNFIRYSDVKDYPLLPLIIVLQGSGFDTDYFDILGEYYTWNGDPATDPQSKEKKN